MSSEMQHVESPTSAPDINRMPGPGEGRLRLYLGAAPGVGKTFTMLQEALRLKQRDTDVVVGLIDTHDRPQTTALLDGLEIVPPRMVPYRGALLSELDTAAVIARRPQIALVDELAHTNVAGSPHEKRYQDVLDLLKAGISVFSTLNIQHVESLQDTIRQLTGVTVHETVPDWVVDLAEQVELIDLSPEALIDRMRQGEIFPPEQARLALANFFTPANLSALRNLSLSMTTRGVKEQLTRLMLDQNGHDTQRQLSLARVMVAVDHRPLGKKLIRQGWRMAAALNGELLVVAVEPPRGSRAAQNVVEERRLRTHLQLAEELGAKVLRSRGKIVDELLATARAQDVSLLLIGQSVRGRREELLSGSVTHDLLRRIRGIDVLVVAAQPSRRVREQPAPGGDAAPG